MRTKLNILPCALKHNLSEKDIFHAWKNKKAMRARNYDIPAIYALAGPDTKGNFIELLVAEQEDGTFLVFHAMKLTKKMPRELELEK